MVAERQEILTPLRALLVEDSEDDALLLLRELRRGGYEPEYERVDTPEAMRRALDGSPHWDVIFSDYNMPRFGAPEALALAREAVPQTPVIVVSGKVGEDAAVATLKAGAYDYVMKSNLARLCATVERSIQEARERRERRRAERELGRRDAILEAVRFAADRFLGEATGWEESVRAVLGRLGEATGVSRVYIFENHAGPGGGLWNVQRYKWLAPGVSPGLPAGPAGSRITDFSYRDDGSGRWADFGRWEEILVRGEPIYGNTRDFPEGERTFLAEKLGILSMVLVPIFVEGRWWGFIGFDECVEEREWSTAEVGALGAAAGTLGAAIRRKQVEEQLRGSEERYRAVIEQATDGIYLLDADTKRLLQTNPSFRAMLGYAAGEMDGMQVYDFVAHPRENVDATIGRTLEERRRIVGERKYRKKDGSLVDVEVGVSVISYGGKEVICTIARDVTERKENEEALRQSEQLYRAVIEQATENIFLVDAETGRIVESNPAFREALGYSEKGLRGMTLHDVVADDRESVDANIRRVLEGKGSFVGVRQYRRKDGSLVDVEVSASTILLDGRETMCAVAHDVTERARAQRLLEERVATLSRISADVTLDLPMESTLNVLAESVVRASTAVACSVSLIDEATGFLRIEGSYGLSEGFERGIETVWREESVRRSPTLEAIRTRQPILADRMSQRMLENPLYAPVHRSVREAEWDTVLIVPLVSRGRVLGAINFSYLQGEQPGEDERVFLSAVTDQAAVVVDNARLFSEARGKAALEERQRLARELHDSVSQALYGIALGARTARALLDRAPEQVADPLDYVLSLADAGLAEMRALIFELRPESLESEGLIAALEKQASALRARHEVEVEAVLCDEPNVPLEKKEALYRIAQEALHNTVKHARANAVDLKMECDPGRITLTVSDDGAGFDPEGDFPGHLGLRSMRERAARLGGTLEIESAPGKGTRIRARIPLRDTSPAPSPG
jgi:PAS domain S-box-containing protein